MIDSDGIYHEVNRYGPPILSDEERDEAEGQYLLDCMSDPELTEEELHEIRKPIESVLSPGMFVNPNKER